MAWYDVTKEIEEISEIENISVEALKEEFEIRESEGKLWATNRSRQGTVIYRLNKLKADLEAVELAKKYKASFHWVKDDEGWAVTGDFSGYKEGDVITVMKRDGSTQPKVIDRFSPNGNAYVV